MIFLTCVFIVSYWIMTLCVDKEARMSWVFICLCGLLYVYFLIYSGAYVLGQLNNTQHGKHIISVLQEPRGCR